MTARHYRVHKTTHFFFSNCVEFICSSYGWRERERERLTLPMALAFSRTYVYMCSTLEMCLTSVFECR
jgi:hypothetical protein